MDTNTRFLQQPLIKEEQCTWRKGEWGLEFGIQDLADITEGILTEKQSVEQNAQRPHLQLWSLVTTENTRRFSVNVVFQKSHNIIKLFRRGKAALTGCPEAPPGSSIPACHRNCKRASQEPSWQQSRSLSVECESTCR